MLSGPSPSLGQVAGPASQTILHVYPPQPMRQDVVSIPRPLRHHTGTSGKLRITETVLNGLKLS